MKSQVQRKALLKRIRKILQPLFFKRKKTSSVKSLAFTMCLLWTLLKQVNRKTSAWTLLSLIAHKLAWTTPLRKITTDPKRCDHLIIQIDRVKSTTRIIIMPMMVAQVESTATLMLLMPPWISMKSISIWAKELTQWTMLMQKTALDSLTQWSRVSFNPMTIILTLRESSKSNIREDKIHFQIL